MSCVLHFLLCSLSAGLAFVLAVGDALESGKCHGPEAQLCGGTQPFKEHGGGGVDPEGGAIGGSGPPTSDENDSLSPTSTEPMWKIHPRPVLGSGPPDPPLGPPLEPLSFDGEKSNSSCVAKVEKQNSECEIHVFNGG